MIQAYVCTLIGFFGKVPLMGIDIAQGTKNMVPLIDDSTYPNEIRERGLR